MTRTGKIARLPRAVREELNRRLEDGEQGKRLVAWLNSLPEVKAMLGTEFGGRPLSEQNLSEWKQGGYLEWQRRREASEVVRGLVEQSNELGDAAGGAVLTERLASVLVAELARQTQELLAETSDPEERWMRLKEAIGKLAQLRHEESDAGQLRLKQDQWQVRQKEAEAKARASQKFFPIHAALLQHGLHGLMSNSTPGAQAAVLLTLERLTKKRSVGEPVAATETTNPIKPIQGKSRDGTPFNQTQSDRIKPNQT